MSRKLNSKLISDLKTGKYKKLLQAIMKDPELTLEIRTNCKAKVYYNKGLILTIGSVKEPQVLTEGYIKNSSKWNVVPQLDIDNPQKYLQEAKEIVRAHSKKAEFAIQQNIAMSNQSGDSAYFIVDMEYAFPQGDIPKEKRLPTNTRIDLVAIEKGTKNIILFELKQGLSALSGTSGADDHFEKTMTLIQDRRFCHAIQEDITNIIKDKKELGLLSCEISDQYNEIKMMYIFAYNNDESRVKYETEYAQKFDSQGVKTLYIDTRYRLSSPHHK